MKDYTIYFKSKNGYDRFIKELYNKYRSIGKFSGNIKLNKLNKDEVEVLSKLYGLHLDLDSDITLSINKFIKIMNNSKYTDFDINTLVSEYLNISLITKKEENTNKKRNEELFYEEIINNSKDIGREFLINTIKNKINPYNMIHQRYLKDKNSLKKELECIINLVNNLPKTMTTLPIYASMYTSDPHYLDIDNSHFELFMYALCFISDSEVKLREDKIKLLLKYNIGIDMLSNYVITYNLKSNKKYIDEFKNNKESLILNIQNIINAEFDSINKKVFIFENPSILSEIISKDIDASVIISSGYGNTALYLLLDKLLESNNELYYNGDFDPEGLLIANMLKNKYKDNLKLICYNIDDYINCKSNKSISSKRLKILDKIDCDELNYIKNILLNSKLSGYQENNKERIINYIKECK